jgi:hypothetical protein
MKKTTFAMFLGLFLAAFVQAGDHCQPAFDVVKPRVPDKLCRVTLNQQELGGEIDRRIQNLIYQNYMVIDLDGKWLDHFRNRTDRGDRSHVYYGIGKVFDAGSLFAAYTGDPKVAARTQYHDRRTGEVPRRRRVPRVLERRAGKPAKPHQLDSPRAGIHQPGARAQLPLHGQSPIAGPRENHGRLHPQDVSHAAESVLRRGPDLHGGPAGRDAGTVPRDGRQRYLDFAADVPHGNNRGEIQLASLRTWEQDFSRRPCHVYVMLARCYAQTELYRLTGEETC